MSKHSIDFSGFEAGTLRHRTWNHIQGVCGYSHRLFISRSGESHSELIVTKDDTYQKVYEIAESHLGGIDISDPYLAIPCYNHGDVYGSLRFYDINSMGLFDVHALTHRAYAVGIAFEGYEYDDKNPYYLIAVVLSSDGRLLSFYRWYADSHTLNFLRTIEMDGKTSARNNIVLSNTGKGMMLFSMRAHFGRGVIHAYEVEMPKPGMLQSYEERGQDVRNIQLHPRYIYERRNGWCSSRFGATIVQTGRRFQWLRTTRNILHGKLGYRLDDISFREVKGGEPS